MFKKRNLLAVMFAVGSLAILSGCGSSSNSTLSYSAFSTAANKICKSVSSQTNGSQATATANAASATAIGKVITAASKGLSQLAALKGPAALESARDAFNTVNNKEITAAKQAESAAKAGNQSAYTTAVSSLAQYDSESDNAGSKLGAPGCASSN